MGLINETANYVIGNRNTRFGPLLGIGENNEPTDSGCNKDRVSWHDNMIIKIGK